MGQLHRQNMRMQTVSASPAGHNPLAGSAHMDIIS